jgi:ankyrin repeat protein
MLLLQDGETALHVAAFRGTYEVLEEILKNGADVNAENKVLDSLHGDL